jgi:hypothetical protein
MNEQIPPTNVQPFDYRRDKDGCDDTFDIIDHRGTVIASIHFWDEPDTDAADRAEANARLLSAAPSLLAVLESFEAAWQRWADEMARRPEMALEMFHIDNAARDAIARAKPV